MQALRLGHSGRRLHLIVCNKCAMYLHTYRKELKYRGLQWRIVPVTPEVEGSSPFRTAE